MKKRYVKLLALAMSICYLTSPLQHQIKTVLHELSHSLELPRHVLSHESEENTGFAISEQYKSHSHVSGHSHGLIDFIDTIFEASKEHKGSKDSKHSETKLDKHLTNNSFQLPSTFRVVLLEGFGPPKMLYTLERFEELGHPPRPSSS